MKVGRTSEAAGSRLGGRLLLPAAVGLSLLSWVLILSALSQGSTAYARPPGCPQAAESSGVERSSAHDCRPDEAEVEPSPEPEPEEPPPPEPEESPPPEEEQVETLLLEQPTATASATPTASPTLTPEPTSEPVVLAAVAEPKDSPSPSPTATATMTPTATATPTPTAVPVPTVAPVSEVRGLVIDPPPVNFLADFQGLGEVSTSLGVVGTNLSLALLTLLLILTATTIFNATIKENAEAITLGLSRFTMPAMAVAGTVGVRFAPFSSHHPRSAAAFRLLGLLGLTAMIYATLDPHFGFNDASLVLIVGLMTGLTLTTFLYEGGQVLFSTRALRLPAAIRAYPLALAIAAVSVVFSRVIQLNPGVIFGFVAGAALARGGVGRKEQGLMVLLPMLGVLGVSLIALLLIDPLRTLNENHSSVWYSLPETAAVAVFVGGAESVLLSLIPLTFNDGQKVWSWNRWAWAAVALPASFLFFHVIVNRNESYGSLIDGAGLGPLLAAVVFLMFALAVWLYFQLRERKAGA